MRKTSPLLTAGLALCVLMPASAQAPAPAVPPSAPMFPFVIPWDDAVPGTATDVSFLNTRPAGKNGRIVAKGGHFVEGGTGKRIRFLGTNFAAGAAFPSHQDAEKVAARIAKLGINIVRMHHMDNISWGPGQSIWDAKYKDHQHIDPAQLDKLDYLISQLKKNGVYVNLNLHVSRQFTPEDGFPASVNDIQTSFDKRVDEYDRRMIQLQKNYARDLLTHVNPYTKLSYAADPCVAVVEINNENSLVGDPWASLGAGLSDLPEPFRGELVGFWNDWLLKKYKTNSALQAAWLKNATPSGPSLFITTTPWTDEHQGTSMATMTVTGAAGTPGTAPPIQVNVTQTDGTDWHVQAHQTGLDFHNDTTYTVTFRAKADKARTMPVGASLDQNDWHNIGLQASAALTPEWKDFRFTFDAHDVVPQHGRIAFTLGGQTGTVWISDLKVAPGSEGAGLQPGQSLTAKTVDMPAGGRTTKVESADWIAFLADTERAYAEEMRRYLKSDLRVQANVICSQMGYGGLTSVGREANMDFADNHAYWQHPSFPHKAWDSNDWNIPNTSMVSDLAAGKGGTLRGLAEYRIAGKPYTVSEYNHPAPNDFQAETVPLLATFAAFQDWDIIYLFDYGSYGARADNEKIQGYFGIGSNPAKTAFLPAAAMIFRAGEMTPANDPLVLNVPIEPNASLLTPSAAWHQAANAPEPDLFSKRIGLLGKTMPAGKTAVSVTTSNLGRMAQSSLHVTNATAGGQYVAGSPASQTVVGFVGGQTVTLGPVTMTFPQFGNNFAAVTLTAMDNQPLAQSKRMLLTLAGKVENQGMVWNAGRTSVGNQWGHGPSVAEGIPATVTFTSPIAQVYALDGTGKRAGAVKIGNGIGGLVTSQVTVGPQYNTLWYEITR